MPVAAKLAEEIEIPAGVTAEVSGAKVSVSGSKGKVERAFKLGRVRLEKAGNKVIVSIDAPRRKEKALYGSISGHVRNMLDGAAKGYEYKLVTFYSHFPISVAVDKGKVMIKNFLGEKAPRYADIVGDTKVEVKGQEIFVRGANVEAVGQTAANMVIATRVKRRDPRVFADGIFIATREGAK
jgi:large subunit ribosomal protein L6